jgi:hypothetical protein
MKLVVFIITSIIIVTFNVIIIMNDKILSRNFIITVNLNINISIMRLKPKADRYIFLAVDIKRTILMCNILGLSNFDNPATVITQSEILK